MANSSKNIGELSSWKEIADYLGVSERTAQKWETERGLPIQRLPGTKGRVVAKTAALEAWKTSNLRKIPWHADIRILRVCAAVTALLFVAASILLAVRSFHVSSPGPPAQARRSGKTLIVEDANGREVWRWLFPDLFLESSYAAHEQMQFSRSCWFGHLLPDDGETKTIFIYDPVSRNRDGTRLICFSEKGGKLWEFRPGKEVRDRRNSFENIFIIEDFHVQPLEKGAEPRILVTSHHFNQQPNQFAILGAKDGHVVSEYWHSGYLPHLDTFDVNGDGVEEILLAGVNNGYHAATLVILDPRNVNGASTQPEDDHTQLLDFAPGTEFAAIDFPRTCLSVPDNVNSVYSFRISESKIDVEVRERINSTEPVHVHYLLNRGLQVTNVLLEDRFRSLHHALYLRKELDHELTTKEEEQIKKAVSIRRGQAKP